MPMHCKHGRNCVSVYHKPNLVLVWEGSTCSGVSTVGVRLELSALKPGYPDISGAALSSSPQPGPAAPGLKFAKVSYIRAALLPPKQQHLPGGLPTGTIPAACSSQHSSNACQTDSKLESRGCSCHSAVNVVLDDHP